MRRLAATALLYAGCATEFLLGDDTDGATTSSGMASTSSTPETSAGPSSDPTSTTSSTAGPTETTAETTSTSETTTSESATETDTDTQTTTSTTTTETAGVETTTTTGDIGPSDCVVLENQEACEAEPPCDWIAEQGCFTDACHSDAEALCAPLLFKGCEATPACFWYGLPERGECGFPPCAKLGAEACNAEPACTWSRGELFCFAAECPACTMLESEPACAETLGCSWIADVCVPD